MEKSKSNEALDRLSELPNSVIFAIFGLLPMGTVVKTTILSKRWRNLWTTAPCLNFVDYLEPEYFITRALMFWRGTKILVFNLGWHLELDKYKIKNIDTWLRFAKDYEVQELYLHLSVCSDEEQSPVPQYPVPQYLCSSCPSLQVLSLRGCKVHINRNVQWNQLKSLTISTENGLRCADIDRVLSGSPQLEDLVMRFYETHEHLTIRSTSLKKLSIDKFIGCYDKAPPMNTRLIISTPNLETFGISNVPYFYCSLDSVSSLTEVSLLFDDCGYHDDIIGLLEEALKQILPAIQHVESVTLSYWSIMALGELKRKHLVPRLWDVKFIKLNAHFSNQEDVVCALEIFSKVEMLVLEDVSDEDVRQEKFYLEFQPNLPNLRRVEVIWGQWDYYAIFSLMEILLKYASNLENMVFRVERPLSQTPSTLFFASEDLQRMQRSFPGKLIVCESLTIHNLLTS